MVSGTELTIGSLAVLEAKADSICDWTALAAAFAAVFAISVIISSGIVKSSVSLSHELIINDIKVI